MTACLGILKNVISPDSIHLEVGNLDKCMCCGLSRTVRERKGRWKGPFVSFSFAPHLKVGLFSYWFSLHRNQNNKLRLILSCLDGISRTGEVYSQRHFWLTFQTKGLYEVHLYKHAFIYDFSPSGDIRKRNFSRLFTVGFINSWTVTFRKKSRMKTFSVAACTQVLACGGCQGVGPWEAVQSVILRCARGCTNAQ